MGFGWAGAAAGASDTLQEMLVRAFAQKQAQEQLALQQQRLAQDRTQFDATMGQNRAEFELRKQQHADDQAHRTGQVERQAKLDRTVENQTGVRRMIGDFLVQRGGKPIGAPERQTLTGMAVQEDIDLPRTIADDPNREHQERLAEIAAQGKNAMAVAGMRANDPSGADYITLASPDGQLRQVTKGPAANELLGQGWKIYDTGRTRGPIGQERAALAFFNRAKQAMDTVDSLEGQIAGQSTAGQLRGQYAPNLLQTQTQQQYRQAQRAFTEARLRKESGAAIPPGEYDNDARTYFAQPGDTPEVVEQKRTARQAVLDGIGFAAGPAYEEFYGEPFKKNAAGVNPQPQKPKIKSIRLVP